MAFCLVGVELAVHAEELVTLNGLTYSDIRITRIESDAILILHSAGAARIPANQLPPLFKQQHALSFKAPVAATAESPQDIVTVSGKVYAGAIVKRVEPDRILILYKEGATVVPFTDLPATVQKKYNYDPAKAQAYAENRAAAENDRVASLLGKNNASPHASRPVHGTQVTPGRVTGATPTLVAKPTALVTSAPAVPPAATHLPAASETTSAPVPPPVVAAAEPAPAAAETPAANEKITLEDLIVLAEEIDLVGEEERSRIGGTVNWRPATQYYYYYDYYYYYGRKREENDARRKKLEAAKGNRLSWSAAAGRAKVMLRSPVEIPPIKGWLEKFIATSELAGTNRRDDYHHKCKELKEDLEFLIKAGEKPQ